MEAFKGYVRDWRIRNGQNQYLIREEGSDTAYWCGSELLDSPEDIKEIQFFMVWRPI